MKERVLLEEMTWPEVRERISNGCNVAVFACGATEQHGPHLPLGTDTYLGTAIAERAAQKAGNALVAPTVRPGLSEHHMSFAGSMTLQPDTFIAVLGDYCSSLARHGFQRIVMFPSHGGNADMMAAYLPYIARPLAGRCEVSLAIRAALDFERMMRFAAEHGIRRGQAGVHAGWIESSMMLAAQEQLVRLPAAAAGRNDEEFFQPDRLSASQIESFLHGIESQSPNGVLGDPTGADARAGRALIDLAASSLASELTSKRT